MEPMIVVASLRFGGGRGCVAKRDLSPGTLVLVENPIASWPQGEPFDLLNSLEHILNQPDATAILHAMEEFHPTKTDVDSMTTDQSSSNNEQVDQMMTSLREQFSDDAQFQNSVEVAARLHNSDGSPLSRQDVLRLVLALRYNALQSGMFLYSAMLNHADQPNCVKFMPTQEKSYSEVRATRFISAGEPLTISYLPNILSHASRRKALWEQHRFDIGADLAPTLYAMETVGNKLPASNLNHYDNEETTTQRIEKAVTELQDINQHLSSIASLQRSTQISEQVKALEQASLELCTEAENQLQNEHHLLLIPCRQLHLDSCDLVQRDPSLKSAPRSMLVGRLIETAQKLTVLQKAFYGPDHFDLARTYNDISQAIEELLSRNPKQLLSLGLDGLSNASAWSSLENTARKEYNRIKVLYPYDVESVIHAGKIDH
jgi:hypothetical protein